ncbi:MAG TPA: urease accessory protein UreE [Cyanobacteria bacterium UBA11149]|nr:urease accessory protein UreE [Cyanobacteria bacterium UBA11367]HBE56178.1 urease accessory protein UreE [Cyanobacteria bacterium UBA11366]HBK62199.1 urease accessory protein UreE [Cyanobacteria bacterium UBA11166]HBR73892.1 urease accessory protein UreE [Cyanobacteria bacterium UBA11159]HBS70223.1 urease accessory protein UreE [Cyanobacteria bacterium UBA11153]HBW90856.1 urease accessory protein UreE [Cyanobacteria bacterium UBA11149]HCA96350.1 urease accessory protein UreE [Cyanobacteria
MLTFTQRIRSANDIEISFTLSLTASERTRTRHRFETHDGESLYLRLPRGTILQDGDLLRSQIGDIVIRIAAKPEAVLTVTTQKHLDLLRAAYHLGNRHVPLEITPNYLRLSPDPVLQGMLEQLGVDIKSEILPFHPEIGAYRHSH